MTVGNAVSGPASCRKSSMQCRLAEPADADGIACILTDAFQDRADDFILKLGVPFLSQYTRFVLADPRSVSLCVFDDDDRIVGVEMGTLDAAGEQRALRRHTLQFAVAALPALLRRPALVAGLIRRYLATFSRRANSYVVNNGARIGYWAVTPEARRGAAATELHRRFLDEMRSRGASRVAFDVAEENEKVIEVHQRLGARVVQHMTLPDGRRRVRMEYVLRADQADRFDWVDSHRGTE